MKKKILIILNISIILVFVLFNTVTAFANEIVISSNDQGARSIVSTSQDIEIPIMAVEYNDVYAFDIEFLYDVDEINFVEIKQGDLFNGLSSEVLINELNNEDGTARYTQTLIDTDNGVTKDGVLCTLNLSFEYGNYDLSDLGIIVQIADSAPNYLEANLTDLSIVIDADAVPTPTPSETPTPNVTPTPSASPTPDATVTSTPDDTIADSDATPKPSSDESDDLPSTATSDYLWLVLSIIVVIIASTFLFRYRK